jgi:allantoinase
MSDWDLVVRGGRVVTPEGVHAADLAVLDGRIAALGPRLNGAAACELDASGCHLFPGIVDAHVHFNEPGRASWEGLSTGSRALAAGGGTTFFDMPLNSEPPVTTLAAFAAKRRRAEAKSWVDFGLWAGLVPGNRDALAALARAGAVGFKAFLCDSGMPSFPRIDPAGLKAGMREAAAVDRPVAVHAEDPAGVSRLTRLARARGRRSVRAWQTTRPVVAEVAAIRLAVDLAGETGCRLHIVHVSSPEGLEVVARARRRGVDVSAETCPHYLLLNAADVVRLGAVAKCSPPIRDEARRRSLWRRLAAGDIDTIGSDHSPAAPALKQSADFFDVWGGIAGVQHGAELVLSSAESAAWPRLAAVLARNVAWRFGLAGSKGMLAVGCDADFSVIGPAPGRVIAEGELLTRHWFSPYVGRSSRIQIRRTYLRGRPVYPPVAGAVPRPGGRFVRPQPINGLASAARVGRNSPNP